MFAESSMALGNQMGAGPSLGTSAAGDPSSGATQAQPRDLVKCIDDTRRQNASTILI